MLTKAICNKGFSGNSSVLPRSNFGVGGQESSTQSLTAYSLGRHGAIDFLNSVDICGIAYLLNFHTFAYSKGLTIKISKYEKRYFIDDAFYLHKLCYCS